MTFLKRNENYRSEYIYSVLTNEVINIVINSLNNFHPVSRALIGSLYLAKLLSAKHKLTITNTLYEYYKFSSQRSNCYVYFVE